jgi:ABC-type xylose transport system permease subunit
MRRNGIQLSRRHQAWLYVSFGILLVTGILWLVFHNFVHLQGEFGPVTHPVEPWSLKIHGAAAMLSLIVLGTLIPGHIRRGWHARKNRMTGLGLIALNGLLILSGYALYYFGGEQIRPIISALHWILGLTFPLALSWHIWQGRRERRTGKVI